MIDVINLLKNGLDCKVYTGQIPETQTNPAVLLVNIANPFTRTLSGKKIQKYTTWRVTVVAKEQSQAESIMAQLEALDASCDEVYQRIFSNLVHTDFGKNEEPYRKAFYDLTLHKR